MRQKLLHHFWFPLIQAGMFSTRLPLKWLSPPEHPRMPLGALCPFFPLWGALIAAIAIGVIVPLQGLGTPWPLLAGLLVGIGILLSGALHEDGLADCCDGFWGAQTPEKRRTIMKDSRLGSYGVLGLIFSLASRWCALALLEPAHAMIAFLLMHCIPRGHLGWLWATFSSKAETHHAPGLTDTPPHIGHGLIGLMLAGLLASTLIAPLLMAAGFVVAAGIGMAAFLGLAQRKLGRINGDCLGAAEQIGQMILAFAFSTIVL